MPYIYKYVNKDTDDVEYVGIIKSDSNFPNRFIQHKSDGWYQPDKYKIYFKQLKSQTDAEALEGHFIALYGSYKYHNKAKAKWGECSFAPDIEWYEFDETLLGRKLDKMAHLFNLDPEDEYLTQKIINAIIYLYENQENIIEQKREARWEATQELAKKICSKERKDEEIADYHASLVAQYLNFKTEKAPGNKIKREELFLDFTAFCLTIQVYEYLGKIQFYKAMRKLGIVESRDGKGAYFWGIKIKEVK